MAEAARDPAGASATAAAIRAGALDAREPTAACLGRAVELEPSLGVWAFLDPERARAQAELAAEIHRAGRPQGPLHGVPVAVSDLFDTADMPTQDGSPLHAGRTPRRDAAAVARLRAAGAVILGKTETAELGIGRAPRTRNPLDPKRIAGSTCGGAAAAVAAGMVPVALGNQHSAGIVASASYCGVLGFKPSRGAIARSGMLRLSALLDQPGVFARSIEDLALAARCLYGPDSGDADARASAAPPLVEIAAAEPPVEPRLCFVPPAGWDRAPAETRDAFAELVEALGEPRIETLNLPERCADAVAWHRRLIETDAALALAIEYAERRDGLSPALQALIERGRSHLAFDYAHAAASVAGLTEMLDQTLFAYDAILTPAVPGPAPTGEPEASEWDYCRPWTLCGLPCLSLPLLADSNGLPVGVQLVGAPGNDARLLRIAGWLARLDLA
ncbi:MAG: amidase [Alphaproteobacteria bacterium]|nr:amidase [Alphaproteobacteria bacterium]